MASSNRFRQLSRELATLREELLPRKFDPTGSYSPRVHKRAAGYRLLCHAEFEAFLEDRASEHLLAVLGEWKNNQRHSLTLTSLVAYDDAKALTTGSVLDPKKNGADAGDVHSRITGAVTRYQAFIRRENHGIRENNVLKILLPIGVQKSDLDHAWLTLVDSWGQQRGVVAHSSNIKIPHGIDPKNELDTVRGVAKGFKTVDDLISKL